MQNISTVNIWYVYIDACSTLPVPVERAHMYYIYNTVLCRRAYAMLSEDLSTWKGHLPTGSLFLTDSPWFLLHVPGPHLPHWHWNPVLMPCILSCWQDPMHWSFPKAIGPAWQQSTNVQNEGIWVAKFIQQTLQKSWWWLAKTKVFTIPLKERNFG